LIMKFFHRHLYSIQKIQFIKRFHQKLNGRVSFALSNICRSFELVKTQMALMHWGLHWSSRQSKFHQDCHSRKYLWWQHPLYWHKTTVTLRWKCAIPTRLAIGKALWQGIVQRECPL
jgi:hypothetical protein